MSKRIDYAKASPEGYKALIAVHTVLHKSGREETLWRYQIGQVGAGAEVTESYRFLWCPIVNRIAELPIPRDKQLRRGIQQTLNRIKAAAEQR